MAKKKNEEIEETTVETAEAAVAEEAVVEAAAEDEAREALGLDLVPVLGHALDDHVAAGPAEFLGVESVA